MNLVLHFAAQLNTRLPSKGKALLGKAVVPGVCRNTYFQQYGDDSAYNLVLSPG